MSLPMDVYPAVMRALTLISQGRTKTSACDDAQISTSVFDRHVRGTPELAQMYEEAEQRGMDTLADILLEIDSNDQYGSSDPKVQKVMSDNIKWYLSRKRPKQYGDKVTIEHSITADKAIIDALERGKARAIGQVVEDVAYTVVEEFVDLSEFA